MQKTTHHTAIKKALTDKEKDRMLKEAKSVTAWVYEYIRIICKSDPANNNVES